MFPAHANNLQQLHEAAGPFVIAQINDFGVFVTF